MADESEIPEAMRDQLGVQVNNLRELAITSSDPLVVSKAIAVSDKGVQYALLTRLATGEQLAEVLTLQGTSRDELQVFFRFTPHDGGMNLIDTGLLAFVDMTKGEVSGTLDSYVLQKERAVGRPFVLVDESQAAPTAGSEQLIIEREREFFRSIGLSGGLGGSGDTICNTDVASTTYSGQPYRPDDSGKEGTGDYCDSPGPILA